MALPYLDKFVKELFRLDPATPGVVRVAHKSAVLPLATPVKGRDGRMMDSVRVQKGTNIFICKQTAFR